MSTKNVEIEVKTQSPDHIDAVKKLDAIKPPVWNMKSPEASEALWSALSIEGSPREYLNRRGESLLWVSFLLISSMLFWAFASYAIVRTIVQLI